MLFNRKLSKYISVVLASSAFCSNSLVSANTGLSTVIVVPSSTIYNVDADYTIKIEDGTPNEKLLRFIMNKLGANAGDQKVLGGGEINYKNGQSKMEISKLTVEAWFRCMLCKCFQALERDRLLEVSRNIRSFHNFEYNIAYENKFKKLFELFHSLEIPMDVIISTNLGKFAEQFALTICDFFDYHYKYFKDEEKRIKFWGIMTDFFRGFIVDLSNISFCDKIKFERAYYSNCFSLATNMLKLFGVYIDDMVVLYYRHTKVINEKNFDDMLKDCVTENLIRNSECTLKTNKLVSCLDSFCDFVSNLFGVLSSLL